MSRYILEIKQDASLFRKFLNGSWYPNFDEYRLFLHKQEKNNSNFAKTINRYHLVKANDQVIETVFSKDLDSVSTYLERDATLIQSSYGTIRCNDEQMLLEEEVSFRSCYISNGIFCNTKDMALRMRSVGGSFIVGVCDNPNSIFFQENIKRIEELKKLLRKYHISYQTCKHNNHRDKTLILYYRSDSL